VVTQFLYVCMRTEPDDFRLVSIELKTAKGEPLSYVSWALWQACPYNIHVVGTTAGV